MDSETVTINPQSSLETNSQQQPAENVPNAPTNATPLSTPAQPVDPVDSASPPPPRSPSHASPLALVMKIAGGLVFVVILIFILAKFIQPMFHKEEKVTLMYWGIQDDPSVLKGVIDAF